MRSTCELKAEEFSLGVSNSGKGSHEQIDFKQKIVLNGGMNLSPSYPAGTPLSPYLRTSDLEQSELLKQSDFGLTQRVINQPAFIEAF